MTTASPTAPGHDLVVVDVIEETDEAKSFVLAPPAEVAELYSYLPGQFLTLRIPSDLTGHVARSYSLSSTPGLDPHLKVTVKRTRDGYGSNWLCDHLAPADVVRVLPPSGRFTPAGYEYDLLLLAAGSGITPVLSILKDALQHSDRRVTLFYANRDRGSVIFDAALSALAQEHPDRLTLVHWIDVERGLPTPDDVRDLTAALGVVETFTCGPTPFMSTVTEGLDLAGVPRARQHQEVFASLSGDPFAPPTSVPTQDAGGVETQVTIDDETHSFLWAPESTLVDALLARGVDVPYSCRSGECGSCACTVVSGEVDSAPSDILDPADVADGYVLGCQSRPRRGPIAIEF